MLTASVRVLGKARRAGVREAAIWTWCLSVVVVVSSLSGAQHEGSYRCAVCRLMMMCLPKLSSQPVGCALACTLD